MGGWWFVLDEFSEGAGTLRHTMTGLYSSSLYRCQVRIPYTTGKKIVHAYERAIRESPLHPVFCFIETAMLSWATDWRTRDTTYCALLLLLRKFNSTQITKPLSIRMLNG